MVWGGRESEFWRETLERERVEVQPRGVDYGERYSFYTHCNLGKAITTRDHALIHHLQALTHTPFFHFHFVVGLSIVPKMVAPSLWWHALTQRWIALKGEYDATKTRACYRIIQRINNHYFYLSNPINFLPPREYGLEVEICQCLWNKQFLK